MAEGKRKKFNFKNSSVWDFLLTILFTYMGLSGYLSIHPIFIMLLGAAAACIFVILLRIKIVGKFIQVIMSLYWAYGLWSMLCGGMNNGWFKTSVLVVFCILFAAIKEVSVFSSDSDGYLKIFDFRKKAKPQGLHKKQLEYSSESRVDKEFSDFYREYDTAYNKRKILMDLAKKEIGGGKKELKEAFDNNNSVWSRCSEEIRSMTVKMKKPLPESDIYNLLFQMKDLLKIMIDANERVEEEIKQEKKESECSVGFQNGLNPFAGCDSLDRLERRYKDLVKSFHPDTDSGDTESMQFINSEYKKIKEKLLKER